MSDHQGRLGESALIARYFAPLCQEETAFGLTDDVAFLPVLDGQKLVLTKDMLVANVHFFADDQPDLIAAKALRVNLSDLAAKGAKPLGYLLGLGLPSDWTEDWIAQFCAGLERDQKAFDFPLLGGDTVKNPERLTLSITAFGTIAPGQEILRKNATSGDLIYVSGTIGDGALGLKTRQGLLKNRLSDQDHSYLTDRYLLPRPRVELSQMITDFASASMDISDGLLGDAAKMATASDVAMIIDQDRIPLSRAAKQALNLDPDLWHSILGGGDDYELLFTVPPCHQTDVEQMAQQIDVAITSIGSVQDGAGVHLKDASGHVTPAAVRTSYEHF